ncbi:MAG: LysR family transcriptional regulator [Kaiparowitsia implicata GSE-PSE-MK54-09C]|jgi:DNA-binding transcriptional LysR family regulator|nr:LysR family transcriptional regulator [Kaiparowitsia implicata GSE-PSE-MK54-09C]
MEMHQVRYTLAVARALNFTKGAESCHASQPALSKAIKSLEAELGAALFLREGKQVIITEFGHSMIPHLQRIADEAEMAAMLATNFKLLHKVPIRLGVLCTIGPMRLSRFLASVQQQYPGIELAVRESTVSGLMEDLDAGELDFAVLGSAGDPPRELSHIPLYDERYVVVFPPDHRLSSSNAIPLHDLSGEPYVDRLSCEMREMVMAVCQERAIEVYATFRSEREDWVQSMVMARMGFAFMPEYSVTLPGLLQRPLVDPEVKRRVSLVHKPGRQFSPAASAFALAARSFDWPG